MQELIAAKADVNARRADGVTVLMQASQEGQRQIVQMLLTAKADVNARLGNGATALMLASQIGHGSNTDTTCGQGRCECQAGNGATALMLASQYHRQDVVTLLKDAGAR